MYVEQLCYSPIYNCSYSISKSVYQVHQSQCTFQINATKSNSVGQESLSSSLFSTQYGKDGKVCNTLEETIMCLRLFL